MTDESANTPRRPRVEIELEALPEVVVDPNVGFQAAYYPGVSQRGDNGLPVPNSDGYLCPQCKYDVRGLPGRTCPECGHMFTLGEARNTGRSNTPRHKMDLQAMAMQRWTVYGAILLFAGSFALPSIIARALPTWGDVAIQVIFLMPFGLVGMLYCYCLMKPARDGFFVSALLFAVFSVILAVI